MASDDSQVSRSPQAIANTKAQFLALSQELVNEIVFFAVNARGLRRALRLRYVSKAWNVMVLEAICESGPPHSTIGCPLRLQPSSRRDRGAWEYNSPTIRHQGKGIGFLTEGKSFRLMRAVAGAGRGGRLDNLEFLLGKQFRSTDPSSAPTDSDRRLAGHIPAYNAAACRNPNIMRSMIATSIRDNWDTDFGCVLELATRRENEQLIRLLAHYEQVGIIISTGHGRLALETLREDWAWSPSLICSPTRDLMILSFTIQ
ncbi:hypothetical protein GGR57DRAFT_508991 [Xylariaceae sp. FL1272]|nr:hypothetical protein GGR57DRAFT_508991 [Xylariaceae sp. FL1272]